MNNTGSKGIFHQRALNAKKDFEAFLENFDKLILGLKGNPESDSAERLKSLLQAQANGLIQHLKILSAIFSISSLFSSHSSLKEVLSLIVESVREVLNFSRVIILLLNRDHTLLKAQIITGVTTEQKMRALSKPLLIGKHDCIETKVVRHGESYLIKDISDRRLTDIDRTIFTHMGLGSTIDVPITSKSGIIGVLGINRSQRSRLPPLQAIDVGRVQLFANYIGVLIENAKLYESIIEHKNRFENIVQQSPDGVIITAPTGEIKLINQAGERLLGVNKIGFLGRRIEELLGSGLGNKVMSVLSEQERAQFYDLDFERPDGQAIILHLTASNIKIENRSELLIIFQDITDKKMIDKHLQRLDKLASIGTIAAGIAHEIRSPLTSVSMDLDSLYEDVSDKEKVQQTIVQVLHEIERMDKIISNLLQFSRPSSRDFVPFEIADLIRESISLAKKKVGRKRIRFETHLPGLPLEITGNPDRLRQMALNLLINAVEAIEFEGVITTEAGFIDETQEPINETLKDNFFKKYRDILRIEVKDTGPGVPVEFKDKIFDPYFTTKNYGTGLGLAIASKIVEEHRGYVALSDGSDQGALFEVFLPKNPSND